MVCISPEQYLACAYRSAMCKVCYRCSSVSLNHIPSAARQGGTRNQLDGQSSCGNSRSPKKSANGNRGHHNRSAESRRSLAVELIRDRARSFLTEAGVFTAPSTRTVSRSCASRVAAKSRWSGTGESGGNKVERYVTGMRAGGREGNAAVEYAAELGQ